MQIPSTILRSTPSPSGQQVMIEGVREKLDTHVGMVTCIVVSNHAKFEEIFYNWPYTKILPLNKIFSGT